MTLADAARGAGLRRFVERPPARRMGEMCEMCAAPLGDAHQHLVNLESRTLLCACRACYLLFVPEGAARGKYRAVPDRVRSQPGFRLDEGLWEALQIPVRMAFFFYNSALGRIVAFYPSPAGATESLLPLEAWQELTRANPGLENLAPDVEALLVYGRRGSGFSSFIAPLDACYELTGLVKRFWKGFDGGDEVWRQIEAFFAQLRSREAR